MLKSRGLMPIASLRSPSRCDPYSRPPGIQDNDDDWGNKVVKVVVDIDQDRVRQLGITSEEIAQRLGTYFTGTAVSTYREGDNLIPIALRGGVETYQSLEGLTSATFAKDGELIPLAQVATLKTGFDFSRIRRKNQERTIIATGRSEVLTAGALLAAIQPGLQALDLAGGYHIEIGGEIQKSAETNQKLGAGIPVALALMVRAIILQFNSFRRTLLTFMRVPLIVVGIPYGLLATGQPLSFFGTLGIISLAGIIINNAIVLIDQIDIEGRSRCARRSSPRPKALASDPADLGDHGSRSGADGGCRRRALAADGGAHDVGTCRGLAVDIALCAGGIFHALFVG